MREYLQLKCAKTGKFIQGKLFPLLHVRNGQPSEAEMIKEVDGFFNAGKKWHGKKTHDRHRFLRRPFCLKIDEEGKGTWETDANDLLGGIVLKEGQVREDMKEVADAVLRVRPGIRYDWEPP